MPTKDWVKIKNLKDDDFVICGYLFKGEGQRPTLVLGQYDPSGELIYRGHVTGISQDTFHKIESTPSAKCTLKEPIPASNDNAHWIIPQLVCKVAYMELTPSGSMRQPAFRGIREDKVAKECILKIV